MWPALTLLLCGTCSTAVANDYPTIDRVDHALTCMRINGGQTVENMYSCACEIDVIAQHISFDDFTEGRTYEIYKRMPGEKGGIFRDNPRAEELTVALDKARADAKKRCFVGKRIRDNKADSAGGSGAAAATKPAS